MVISCSVNLMQLRNVTFNTWLQTHGEKSPRERWLRELYPWPVLAQVECDSDYVNRTQRIYYDDILYEVTLKSVWWQPNHGTFRYRLRVESDGLGWHSRSFSDEFDMCGTPDGAFVTLFHTKKEEPLEKIARAFFGRRWRALTDHSFRSLAVSRFLAASIVAQVVEQAFVDVALTHYPGNRLVGGVTPMFAIGSKIWIGYRFLSEDAYAWGRRNAERASKIIVIYFADTKYQFRIDLPSNVEVQSIAQFDATELDEKFEEFIRVLLRRLDLPQHGADTKDLASIVMGRTNAPPTPIMEADVNEALAALKRPCTSKSELRYQLAAGVLLNAWIEDERRLGFVRRKKFYAFKQQIGALVNWAVNAGLSGTRVWADTESKRPILYIRIDDVDFSFHAIPNTNDFLDSSSNTPTWSGVRLKPIAPIVLKWARAMRNQ